MRKFALLSLALPFFTLAGPAGAETQQPSSPERLACAAAGIDPASPALDACAASLKWDIWYETEGPATR